jgi:protein O-mannosyl-transferase
MKRPLFESPLKSLRVAVLLVAALAVLGSANSILNDFSYDDRPIIEANGHIQSWDSIAGSFAQPYWPNEYGKDLGLWRPVVTGIYGLIWVTTDGNATAYHTVLVLMHALAAGLVVVLFAELLPLTVAFLAGLIFSVHPVHTEAVANVVGMAEVWSTALYLGACIVFLRATSGGRRIGLWATLSVSSLFALAFLSKESAVTLPGVLFLLDGARRERRTLADVPSLLRTQGLVYGAIILVAVGVLVGRKFVLGTVADPMPPLGVELLAGDVPRMWTVTQAWPHFFRLLFFPSELSADYSPGVIPITYGWNPTNLLGLALALGALGGSIFAWRMGAMTKESLSARCAAFGVVWFVITISPISNVLFLSGVILAERTLYLPSVGFAVGAAWLLMELRRERPRVAIGAIVVILALMVGKTYSRNRVWTDNVTLFDSLIQDHPESGRAQWLLADASAMVGNVELSIRAYAISIGILNGSYPLLIDVGRMLLRHGREDAAELILKRAWDERPDRGIAPQVLGVLYHNAGRFEEAVVAGQYAVDYYKGEDPVSAHVLAQSLAALERWDESVVARIRTIQVAKQQQWEQWYWLSEAYAGAGDTVQALISLDSAAVRTDKEDARALIDTLRVGLIRQ